MKNFIIDINNNSCELISYIKDFDFSYEGYTYLIEKNFNGSIYLSSDNYFLFIFFANKLRKIPLLHTNLYHGKFIKILIQICNILLIHAPILFFIILYKRPKIIISNTYIMPILLFPISYLISSRLYYVCGDWFLSDKINRGLFNKILNNLIYVYCDYLCSKYSYGVINYTQNISEIRNQYWKNTKFNNYLYPIKIFLNDNLSINEIKNNITFSGNVRKDSGIELIIRNLNKINSILNEKIYLDIIGDINSEAIILKEMCEFYKVKNFVNFHGYLERTLLNKIISNSFCGINLLTSNNSYTTITIPGKIFDYLKNCVPVLISKNIGVIRNYIIQDRLGIEVEIDNNESIINSIVFLYKNQLQFRNNIVDSVYKEDANTFDFL